MILLLIVLIFLWLEITVTSFPLFLIGVLIMIILYSAKNSTRQNEWVFVLAFLGGLILDASAVRFLGSSSLFLTCWLFFILLYERKYEIYTIPFVLAASFFGVFSYLWFFGYSDIFIQSIAGTLIDCALFILFRRIDISFPEEIQFKEL